MPNSRHSEAIVSPSLSRITNRIRSSITERSFHGILLSAPFGPKSVTHVSGTFCYPCLGTDTSTYGRLTSSALSLSPKISPEERRDRPENRRSHEFNPHYRRERTRPI